MLQITVRTNDRHSFIHSLTKLLEGTALWVWWVLIEWVTARRYRSSIRVRCLVIVLASTPGVISSVDFDVFQASLSRRTSSVEPFSL